MEKLQEKERNLESTPKNGGALLRARSVRPMIPAEATLAHIVANEGATEKGLCRAEPHREEESFVCALPAS